MSESDETEKCNCLLGLSINGYILALGTKINWSYALASSRYDNYLIPDLFCPLLMHGNCFAD